MLLLALCVCTLSACGQTGPLYLPGDTMPHNKGAAKSPRGKTPVPVLPPASADPATPQSTKSAASEDADKIVPVTPSIPN